MNSENKQYNSSFITLLRSPWRFKLYLLKKIPLAFMAGLRVISVHPDQASISVSLHYLTRNPFHSIYFACLTMAAELSTGALAMNAVEESGIDFSFLVVEMEASFIKKATGNITFTCKDGDKMRQTVQTCINQKGSATIKATSIGKNAAGETVANVDITWSFKPKN